MSFEFHREWPVNATRKAHRCVICRKQIWLGTPARKFAQKYDGDFHSGYAHPDCRKLWSAAFNLWGDDALPWELAEILTDFTDSPFEVRRFLDAQRGFYPHAVNRMEFALRDWWLVEDDEADA